MKTSSISYKGSLQTKITHIKSGSSYLTDAPTDNNGKGSNFSPTDLVATALASCMITVIGIYCEQHEITFQQAEATVQKTMGDNPRRISEIEIDLDLSMNSFTEKEKVKIKRVAENCPVAKSLAPEIIQKLNIIY